MFCIFEVKGEATDASASEREIPTCALNNSFNMKKQTL